MSKQFFWPAVLIVMGLVLMAANMGYLPTEFMHLWPLVLIVIGLAGLLTADRQEWLVKDEDISKMNGRSRTTSSKPASRKRR